jgi:hypothetical protein
MQFQNINVVKLIIVLWFNAKNVIGVEFGSLGIRSWIIWNLINKKIKWKNSIIIIF